MLEDELDEVQRDGPKENGGQSHAAKKGKGKGKGAQQGIAINAVFESMQLKHNKRAQ